MCGTPYDHGARSSGGIAALYVHRRSLHPGRQREEPEFYEDEEVLHRTGRHWVVLVQRGFIVALAAGFVRLRSSGRSAARSSKATSAMWGRFDPTNVILIVLIGVLVLLWQRRSRRPAKGKKPSQYPWLPDIPFLLGIGVLALLVFFRFRGGRVFYINPLEARGDDPLNLVLTGMALVLFVALVYIVIDWLNDYLILTRTRVIYDDQQLLIRHIQQELLIENIQQVNVRADSYLAYGSPDRLCDGHLWIVVWVVRAPQAATAGVVCDNCDRLVQPTEYHILSGGAPLRDETRSRQAQPA